MKLGKMKYYSQFAAILILTAFAVAESGDLSKLLCICLLIGLLDEIATDQLIAAQNELIEVQRDVINELESREVTP